MTQPKYLGRELLAGGAARSRSSVDLPDLGGSILVQELDGLEAAHFQRRMMETTDQARGQIRDADALAKLNAYVIICGCIDADGKKLFSKEDETAIIAWGSSIQEAIVSEILEISGLSAGARMRLKKSSRTTANGASGSA